MYDIKSKLKIIILFEYYLYHYRLIKLLVLVNKYKRYDRIYILNIFLKIISYVPIKYLYY